MAQIHQKGLSKITFLIIGIIVLFGLTGVFYYWQRAQEMTPAPESETAMPDKETTESTQAEEVFIEPESQIEPELEPKIEPTPEEISKEIEELDADQWLEETEKAFDQLEAVFACMEEAGVDTEKLMGEYFDCVFSECVDWEMTEAEIEACEDACIKPLEKEIDGLIYNPFFRACIEKIK